MRGLTGAEVVGVIIVFIIAAFLLSLVGALILQWAWGTIAVPVFGAPIITYWQAFAAMVLLHIIGGAFKSSRSSK